MVLAPFAPAEARPGWSGETEFVDCETGERRQQRIDGARLARYHEAYRRHFESWRAACVGCSAPTSGSRMNSEMRP